MKDQQHVLFLKVCNLIFDAYESTSAELQHELLHRSLTAFIISYTAVDFGTKESLVGERPKTECESTSEHVSITLRQMKYQSFY